MDENKLIADPAVQKALEKAKKKAEKEAAAAAAKQEKEAKRKEKLEKLKSRKAKPAAAKTEPAAETKETDAEAPAAAENISGERVIVAGEITKDMTKKQADKAEKKIAAAARKAREAEDKLVQRTFVDLTEIRTIERDIMHPGYGHFKLSDGSVMEILAAHGRSLFNAIESDVDAAESRFMECLRRCGAQDLKLIAINAPLNTKNYQNELQEILNSTDSPNYEEMLQENIDQLAALDESTVKRRLFIGVYSQTQEQLEKAKYNIFNSPVPANSILLDEQINVIKKTNNLDMTVDV